MKDNVLDPELHKVLERLIDGSCRYFFPDGAEELETVADYNFIIGVPLRSSEDFRRKVVAAAKASTLNYRSIDYVLKEFGHYWKLRTKFDNDKESNLIIKITAVVKDFVRGALEDISSIKDKPDIPQLFASSAALFRLQNTFRSAIITIRHGYHFESAGLERMILEQLAWIYTIHNLKGEQGDFFKVQPHKCISNLKHLFPYAGELYGLLSESSHIVPMSTLRYVKVKEGQLSVFLTSNEDSKYDAWHLLLLCDAYVVLSELIYSNLLNKYNHIVIKRGQAVPKAKRPMMKILKKYNSLIFSKS